MNLNMTEEHMSNVMEYYEKLPDMGIADRKLINNIVKTMHKYDNNMLNNTALHSLKLMMLLMCENCEDYCENEKYKKIQEELK